MGAHGRFWRLAIQFFVFVSPHDQRSLPFRDVGRVYYSRLCVFKLFWRIYVSSLKASSVEIVSDVSLEFSDGSSFAHFDD